MFDNIVSVINKDTGNTFWNALENEGEFTQDFFGVFEPEWHSYRIDTFWYDKHGGALAGAHSFMGPYTTLHMHLE